MKRPVIVLLSVTFGILSNSTLSAAMRGPEDGEDAFFAPTPGVFDPLRMAFPDKVNDPKVEPHLFKQIGLDFRNVFTAKENLIIVGAGLGAAIGIIGGRTVTIGRDRVRFALSPMVPPGGGVGIQATLLPQN